MTLSSPTPTHSVTAPSTGTHKKKSSRIAIWLPIGTAIVLVVAVFLGFHFFQPTASQGKEAVAVPTAQSSFSIDLKVNEATAYAGIEFALTLSDENAAVFSAFTPDLPGSNTVPLTTKAGKHYFGFYTGTNAFPAGETVVGSLNFVGFTGDKDLTITVTDMTVTRLDDSNNTVSEQKASPAYIFTIHH